MKINNPNQSESQSSLSQPFFFSVLQVSSESQCPSAKLSSSIFFSPISPPFFTMPIVTSESGKRILHANYGMAIQLSQQPSLISCEFSLPPLGKCDCNFQLVRLKIRLARRMPQSMDDTVINNN